MALKGLLLKDSAGCKVATIQNVTGFDGPIFSVSYNPKFQAKLGFAPVQLTETCFLCIKAAEAISIMDFLLLLLPYIFFPFKPFFPLVSWKNLKLFKLEIPHLWAIDVQHHTS